MPSHRRALRRCAVVREASPSAAPLPPRLAAHRERASPSLQPGGWPACRLQAVCLCRQPAAAAPMASQQEQFTHAVLCSFDVNAAPSLRSQANASLEALRQSEEGWSFCLQAFASAQEEHVKFWCLQTVVDMVVRQRRYASLPEERKQQLRSALLTWLQQKGQPQTDEPASIKNKFAQLLVAVVRHDYPASWPDLFTQLLGLLNSGPVSIDLFLRILNTLHDEIVVNEEGNGYDSEVAGRVKDAMRERCLTQLADAWLTILRLHESAPALTVSCLGTVEQYVSW